MLFGSVMSQAMSQMILTDSDTFLLLWFEAVVLLGGSIHLLPLTVYMERCRKVPSVFIPPSVIFSPLSFFILCFWPSLQRAHKQRLCGSVSPTQIWKYNAASWATVAAQSSWRPGQAQTVWYCVKWMCKYYANARRAYHSFRWRISPLTPSVKQRKREERLLLTANLRWIGAPW